MNDLEIFARLMMALRPWLGQLVVVGGWAHRMHRFDSRANISGHPPLLTRDTDLAFSPRTTLEGNVYKALLDAGFAEEMFGGFSPPATHYVYGHDDDAFYAEFLTPLLGSENKRGGEPDITDVRAGITAQKMRYLDLLLISPLCMQIGSMEGLPPGVQLELSVTNPTSFIVQKLLIHSDRPLDKKSQDILYIHDTLELFGGSLTDLRSLWLDEIRPKMVPRTAMKVTAIAEQLFTHVTDTIRNAALIPQDRRLSPENVQRACEQGLREILMEPTSDEL